MRKTYHKLVRDRIPEIIKESGKSFRVSQLRGEELKNYALKKLREEVDEFIENPCAEEAADILEILGFVCNREGVLPITVEAERMSKVITRGAFDMGFLLEWVEDE